MIEITIKRRVPSQNASAFAVHWSTYAKERDAWAVLIRAGLPPRSAPPAFKVRATIVSYRNRFLDYGNLVGGCKPIPDVLTRLGYLRDDKPDWFDCTYLQEKCRRVDERTVITLHNL